MKRFTGILAAAAIALAPMSASALEALTDNAMNDVTAQAGVSIALDDIVIYQTSIADTTYTDTDGMTTGNGTEGNVLSAGIKIGYDKAMQKLTIIDGITTSGIYSISNMQDTFGARIGEVGFVDGTSSRWVQETAFANVDADDVTVNENGTYTYSSEDYAAEDVIVNSDGSYTFASKQVESAMEWGSYMDPTTGNVSNAVAAYATGASPLTIDVGTCESLTAGFTNNLNTTTTGVEYANMDIAGVIIGLPTIEITSYHSIDTKTVSLVTDDAVAVNAGKAFIQITKSGASKMAILGGRLEIAPH